MSEALSGDDFEAEFAAAREAERESERDDDPDLETSGEPLEGDGADDPPEGEEQPPERPALDVERVTKRLRDTQRALKAERAERQKLNARLEALERGGSRREPANDPAALLAALREDDEDPIGDIQTVKQLARLLVGQTQQEREADQQVERRRQALAQVSSTMAEYESDFRDLHPDYDAAAKHFMDARAEELRDTGLTGQELAVAMQNDFAGIVTRSVAAGKDPAEIIYSMAQRRGYKLTQAGAKLETIQRGQAQSRNLRGGAAPQGNLSAAKVADLRGAAFDAAFEKLRAAERRR